MFLRALFLAVVLPVLAQAQDLPRPLTDTVSDFADLLPPEVEARLTATLQANREATGVQIAVVTMDGIAGNGGAGDTIETYAKRLFNDWGIGDAARNDGILILVARDDRAARIALGSGYDAVYDGRATRVIDTAMLPAFREGRYADGIEAGAASAINRLVAPQVAGQPVTETEGFEPSGWGMLLIPLGMVGAFAAFVFRRRIGDQVARVKRCENCNHLGLRRTRDVAVAATTVAAGSGILRDHCSSCGHDRTESFRIPPRSTGRNGGGGSSGFGGGRSSGGGATGRW